VVVTGVSSGIGLGTRQVLIENGFPVFGSVRKKSEADSLQQELGPNFVPLLMDVTNRDAVLQARDHVAGQLGTRTLAGLVNNAGVVVGGPLLYIDHDEYQCQLEVNMIAPLMVTQAFAPLLGVDRQRDGAPGRIVNISSTAAKIAVPFIGAYSASKAGLEGMADALRRELIPFEIGVVLIEPGTVNTAVYDKAEREDISKFDHTPYRSKRTPSTV
jgi:NAD(P)-dependent dehydrogenase (short-subunit alcohol dehydrogenase family)